LQDDEALELPHELGRQLLLLLRVRLLRVLAEVVDQRLPLDPVLVVLAQLVGGRLAAVQGRHRLAELVEVPALAVVRRERVDGRLDHLVDPAPDLLRQVLALEHLAALLVDDHALLVHDVVVLEDVLAHDEVLLLDLLLRVLDLLGEDRGLHRLVVRHLEARHDVLDAVAGEESHELVLAGQVEARLARVSLAAGAAAELVVDAPRLVALRAHDVQAAKLAHPLPELDVDAAAGHVGRDRDCVLLARVLDDLRLARVLLRVQDVVRDAAALEELGEVLRRLHVDRADEHGLALAVALLDVGERGGELRLLRAEDEVVAVDAGDRRVRRDLDHVQAVDLRELLLLRLRRAGHAGELLVQAEVVLERDRRQRDVLLLDLHALLRLDGLVQALAPAAALHDAAGELVDDLHLAVLNDVVDVAVEERLRLDGLDQVVDELDVARVVQVVDPERPLDLLDAARERRDGLELLVVGVVDVRLLALLDLRRRLVRRSLHLPDDAGEVVVRLRGRLGLAGDDERRARLVDQDR